MRPVLLLPLAACAALSTPAFSQALIGDGTSSQTISIGGGALEVSVDLEGGIDTTADGLPGLGAGAGLGVNGSGLSVGLSAPSGKTETTARSTTKQPEMAQTTPMENNPGSTCNQLPALVALEPGEIATINDTTPLVFMTGCPVPVTFSPAAEAAVEDNAFLAEILMLVGFEDEKPDAIARSNYGEIFIFLD